MTAPHQTSLQRKLVLGILGTSGLALTLALVAFLGLEVSGYRSAARRELGLLAEVLGEGSAAALEFREPGEGQRILATLRAHPRIEAAFLLDRQGRLFAAYGRDGSPGAPPAPVPARSGAFEKGRLWTTAPVIHLGETLGTVYLRADTADLDRRLGEVLLLGLGAALLIGTSALLLARRLGRVLSEPILHLTEVAHRMALKPEPGVRAVRETSDEVGVLVDTFNSMLDQVEERSARLEEAQRMAHLGNWISDRESGHSDWSEETYRIFGLDPAAPAPDAARFRTFLPPEDMALLDQLMDRAWEEGVPFELDHRILLRDGQIGWVHASGERYEGPGGHRLLRGTVMDITARKQSEAALVQSQKLESLGVLGGGIAHDFNNLLGAMQGYLELVKMDTRGESPAMQSLERAERVVHRASQLARQMLVYSGKAAFEMGALDLGALVREMGNLLSVSVSKKADLRCEVPEGLLLVHGDGAQIQQVIMNLVINASDALPPSGGRIRVRARREKMGSASLEANFPGQELTRGTYIVLEVEDTGHGMDEATQAKIFDPFFSTKAKGRGLGLAALLGIVKGHHGGIKVCSEVGKGTTFTVLLPAFHSEATEAAPSPSSGGYQGAGLVLVADDEADLRDTTSRFLKTLGFEVIQAAHGRECVDLAREHADRLSLLVLDFMMPHLDGSECMRIIRTFAPSLPIILMSGFTDAEEQNGFPALAPGVFIAKPFTRLGLQARIKELMP